MRLRARSASRRRPRGSCSSGFALPCRDENDGGKLGRDVEVDDVHRGKTRTMLHAQRRVLMEATTDAHGTHPGKPSAGKQPVLGILERGADGTSRVRSKTIPDVRQHRLHREIVENIEEGSHGLQRRFAFVQEHAAGVRTSIINHTHEYARDNVHTKGLTSYWSLLKRVLGGTYIRAERFHLFRYLDEQPFRFNNRRLNDAQRFVLAIAGIISKRLTYAELISADAGTV